MCTKKVENLRHRRSKKPGVKETLVPRHATVKG